MPLLVALAIYVAGLIVGFASYHVLEGWHYRYPYGDWRYELSHWKDDFLWCIGTIFWPFAAPVLIIVSLAYFGGKTLARAILRYTR